jgi:S-adenosylmethionine:tRNA ribosyltransferase-isomerase
MPKTGVKPEDYDYRVPPQLIAQEPAKPRDSARLLIYDRATGRASESMFRSLPEYLPPRSVVVLNRTKVVPARLWCRKASGGKVQVLYVRHDSRYWYALLNRLVKTGESIVGDGFTLTAVSVDNGIWTLRPSFSLSRTLTVLRRSGTTPIPPYIKHSPLTERALRREYQTVFARTSGSVAAPTASLHFTPRLLQALKRAGHEVLFVTLHVGLGTFAPVTAEHLRLGRLHAECYDIDAKTARALSRFKRNGRPIVAVGTTVARALESASDTRGELRRLRGTTDLFIRPGYRWRFVDALITNFHVPKSSLMMLVASLIGRTRLLSVYRTAIRRGFRLFSFGDGMLIR